MIEAENEVLAFQLIRVAAYRHPMHMHGYNMYILHEGLGAWDGTIVRPENPQRRDTYQVQAFGHLVIQFDAGDNPGV